MPLITPKIGLVIRYSFLWSNEHTQGAIEGNKDRPCAIVLSKVSKDTGTTAVTVVPITHLTPSGDKATHLKLTDTDCKKLGLDNEDHWVVLDELNRFTWPGFDLRRRPRTDRYDYGMLPEKTFKKIIQAILDLDQSLKRSGKSGVGSTNRNQ